MEALRDLLDREAVRDLVIRFANAFDLKDWDVLRACLAAELFVDYSAFRGEPPMTVTAEDYVASRAVALANLRTQHQSMNHQVTLDPSDADRAECFSAFLVQRFAPEGSPERTTFDTAGHYRHGCVRTAAGWRIDRITQTVLWNRGNPEIHGAFRR